MNTTPWSRRRCFGYHALEINTFFSVNKLWCISQMAIFLPLKGGYIEKCYDEIARYKILQTLCHLYTKPKWILLSQRHSGWYWIKFNAFNKNYFYLIMLFNKKLFNYKIFIKNDLISLMKKIVFSWPFMLLCCFFSIKDGHLFIYLIILMEW